MGDCQTESKSFIYIAACKLPVPQSPHSSLLPKTNALHPYTLCAQSLNDNFYIDEVPHHIDSLKISEVGQDRDFFLKVPPLSQFV